MMNLCGSDIVTVIVLVISILAVIGKRKGPEKHVASRSWAEDLYPDSDLPEDEPKMKEPASCAEIRTDDAPEATVVEERNPKLAIDKKKLIIYSEIMKPKFDE